MSTVVVGDIHGNSAALEDLLTRIAPYLTSDTTVVFLGDYIDGGPDSKGVVDQLLSFRQSHSGGVCFLKGNHEQWLEKSFRNPTRRLFQSGSAPPREPGTAGRVKTVVVIDDGDHALKQVIHEFPGVRKNEFVFRHFDTIEAFRQAGIGKAYIVFLDFFLSRDRAFGSTVIPELRCEHLVCFSSKKEMSDHMRTQAEQCDRNRIGRASSVCKLKKNIDNSELRKTLEGIFRASEGPVASP